MQVLQQPTFYSKLSINHDPSKRLNAAFLLERACDMLDHVPNVVGARLGKLSQSRGRKWSISLTDVCLPKAYNSIRMVTVSLAWHECQLAFQETNTPFDNLIVS